MNTWESLSSTPGGGGNKIEDPSPLANSNNPLLPIDCNNNLALVPSTPNTLSEVGDENGKSFSISL